MNNMVQFSVIVPLYNKGPFIKSTINSVLSQTYSDFEMVVVDDGSTDNGAEIVRSINDKRINYFYKENGGVSAARNYGIRKAKGEWILLLDADDILLPKALESFDRVLSTYKGQLDIVTGKYRTIKNEQAKLLNKRMYAGIVSNNYKWYFLNKFSVRTGCCILHKRCFAESLFNETLSRFEDLEFILRILKEAKIYVIPDVVFEYHCDSNALSRTSSHKEKDFTFSMNFGSKSFWEKCILGQVLMIAYYSYPTERNNLIRQYKWNVIYAFFAKIKTSFNYQRWEALLSKLYFSSKK